MELDPRQADRRRMERESHLERGPGDPTATKPRDARRVGLLIGAALAIGIVLIGAMFLNNSRYDGNSPTPVAEQRR